MDNHELIEKLKIFRGDYIHIEIDLLINEFHMDLLEAAIYSRIYSFNINGLEYTESQMKLANKLGVNRRTIQRALDRLVNKGFLTKKEGKCDKGKMNTYHI